MHKTCQRSQKHDAANLELKIYHNAPRKNMHGQIAVSCGWDPNYDLEFSEPRLEH